MPSLLERTGSPPLGGPFLQLYISGYNTIFLFILVAFFYGVVRALSCLCSFCCSHPCGR